MIIAVDTNILFDILLDDPIYFETSKLLLQKYSHGSLIISHVVYAEVLTQFLHTYQKDAAQKEFEMFLHKLNIHIIPFDTKDLVDAADRWKTFIGKKDVCCPSCGKKHMFTCNTCTHPIQWRNHILTDFLIGAHAQNHADILLTRDRGFYKNNFSVQIVEH